MATGTPEQAIHSRNVFVVHGRNEAAHDALFAFLQAIGLNPLEWSAIVNATGKTNPYIGEVLETGFGIARAVVVLLTPDDEARLREPYRKPGDGRFEFELMPQSRPNVLFEAGIASSRFPDRTVIVQIGELRPISDLFGKHLIEMNNSIGRRQDLADRLKTAGCDVDLSQRYWYRAGDFEKCVVAADPPESREVSSESAKEIVDPLAVPNRTLKTSLTVVLFLAAILASFLLAWYLRPPDSSLRTLIGLPSQREQSSLEEVAAARDDALVRIKKLLVAEAQLGEKLASAESDRDASRKSLEATQKSLAAAQETIKSQPDPKLFESARKELEVARKEADLSLKEMSTSLREKTLEAKEKGLKAEQLAAEVKTLQTQLKAAQDEARKLRAEPQK
jgi:predicted nucleotide-binding protein